MANAQKDKLLELFRGLNPELRQGKHIAKVLLRTSGNVFFLDIHSDKLKESKATHLHVCAVPVSVDDNELQVVLRLLRFSAPI